MTARPAHDGPAPGQWSVLTIGAPQLKDTLAAFDCELIEAHEIGTHSVRVDGVVATARGASLEPLIFQRQEYATRRVR